MNEKLFEQFSDLREVDDDLPLQDPNQIHAVDVSTDVVEHLNWLANDIAEQNQRVFTLEKLITVGKNLSANGSWSHADAAMIYKTVSTVIKNTGLTFNAPVLESYISGVSLMETTYALEAMVDLKDKVKEKAINLGKNLGNKLMHWSDEKLDFFRRIWDASAANSDRCNKLLTDIQDFTDNQKEVTINVKGKDAIFLGMDSKHISEITDHAITTLKNYHLQDAGLEVFLLMINELKSISVESVEAFDKTAKHVAVDHRKKIAGILNSKGYRKAAPHGHMEDTVHDVYQLFLDKDKMFHSRVTITFNEQGFISSVDSEDIYYYKGKKDDEMKSVLDSKHVMKFLSKDDTESSIRNCGLLSEAISKGEKDHKHEKQLTKQYSDEVDRIKHGMTKFNLQLTDEEYKGLNGWLSSSIGISKILFKPKDDIIDYSVKLMTVLMGFNYACLHNLKK